MENLTEAINTLDEIDAEILRLFTLRMAVGDEIAEMKATENAGAAAADHEADILRCAVSSAPSEYVPYLVELFEKLMELSRSYQNQKRGL